MMCSQRSLRLFLVLLLGIAKSSPAAAVGEANIYAGAVVPQPDQDSILVYITNNGGTDLECDIKFSATAENNSGNQVLLVNEPFSRILRQNRATQYTLSYFGILSWTRNTTGDQSYRIKSVNPHDANFSCKTAQSDQARTLSPGTYMFASAHSGKCVNVLSPDGLWGSVNKQDWTGLNQYDCVPRNNEWNNYYWIVQPSDNAQFRLISEHSGKCLAAASLDDLASAVQVDCNWPQALTLSAATVPGRSEFLLKAANANLCLTVNTDRGGFSNQDQVYMRTCRLPGDAYLNAQLWSNRPAR